MHHIYNSYPETLLWADGMEGLMLYQSGNYDIVLTGLGMSEMSGCEVAQKVKESDRWVKREEGWFYCCKSFKIERIEEVFQKALCREKLIIQTVFSLLAMR